MKCRRDVHPVMIHWIHVCCETFFDIIQVTAHHVILESIIWPLSIRSIATIKPYTYVYQECVVHVLRYLKFKNGFSHKKGYTPLTPDVHLISAIWNQRSQSLSYQLTFRPPTQNALRWPYNLAPQDLYELDVHGIFPCHGGRATPSRSRATPFD